MHLRIRRRTDSDYSPTQVVINFVRDYSNAVARFLAYPRSLENQRMGASLIRGCLTRGCSCLTRDRTSCRKVVSSTVCVGSLESNLLHLTYRTTVVGSDSTLVDLANGQRRSRNAGKGIS